MTLAILLAGVVIVIAVLFAGLSTLQPQGRGKRSVRVKITLVPPSLDINIEQKSD